MSKINGIYAAGLSVLDENLALNVKKTIKHAENLIENGCHGVAIFGSTGQAQLLSVSEKISLLNELSKSEYKDVYLIGTGLNSLNETINLISISNSSFLIWVKSKGGAERYLFKSNSLLIDIFFFIITCY